MSRWGETLSETKRCLYCDTSFMEEVNWTWALGLSEEKLLCPSCDAKVVPIRAIGCEMCGRQVEKEDHDFVDSGVNLPATFRIKPSVLCRDCLRWKEEGQVGNRSVQQRSLYVYNDFLQEVMARFKYRGDAELATLFSQKLKGLVQSLGKLDAVTVIPLAGERLWERGFNQAALLAGELWYRDVLVRVGVSEKQSKRGRRERMSALQGVFRLSDEGGAVDWAGKRIVIVDDIYTTGATLRAAATVLYEAGALEVLAVTVARATGAVMLKNKG
ncbi:ComF family protein [Salipaludibacillus sp. HK11]|uniref:ComF family protein n=1 Tax=Salipaludibacillus sp. HK11 TaxID=3394320 RepID=UPI0039FC6375